MNKVILCGHLTRGVELRHGQSTDVARVGIAVNRPYSKEKLTDFFNLVAFGKTAETLGKYFSKGRKIIVEGHLQTSRYKDKEGNDRATTEIIAESVEFADSKKKAADSKTGDLGGEPVDDFDSPF